MVSSKAVKHIAVKPSTHQRFKIACALKGKEMNDIAEAAIRALEEKWGITLPLEAAE